MKKSLLLTLFPLAIYSCKKGDGAAAGHTLNSSMALLADLTAMYMQT